MSALREAEAELDEYMETSGRDADLISQVSFVIAAALLVLGFTTLSAELLLGICVGTLAVFTGAVFVYIKVSDRTFTRKLNKVRRAVRWNR